MIKLEQRKSANRAVHGVLLGPVAGLRGGLRGHGPTLLLDLCWSHANICTYVECIYTESLVLGTQAPSVDKSKIATDWDPTVLSLFPPGLEVDHLQYATSAYFDDP